MMNQVLEPSTRRSMLQRGLVFIAGVLGVPLAVPDAHGTPTPAPPNLPPAPTGRTTLQFYTRRVVVHCPSRRPGDLPVWGGRLHSHGELLDRPEGAKVGHFSATCFGPESAFGFAGVDHAVELQTLKVANGTLFGIGCAGPTAEGEKGYAVLGGTGHFAGAKGSYMIRQHATGRGEQGVEFLITLQS